MVQVCFVIFVRYLSTGSFTMRLDQCRSIGHAEVIAVLILGLGGMELPPLVSFDSDVSKAHDAVQQLRKGKECIKRAYAQKQHDSNYDCNVKNASTVKTGTKHWYCSENILT